MNSICVPSTPRQYLQLPRKACGLKTTKPVISVSRYGHCPWADDSDQHLKQEVAHD
ncbi:hypothetical protein [Endozoicomonas sp. SCSIO W0465]|uniref:hypothetical protein n=1 Tax=Endozoicomonas sp. SCSIO W0465 TaxID=2918516 RepID=UPI00207641BA|nr:hypothetical protein [Endozoicomonas sp. SCSIO W0465]USE36917.1 hypothetical protein MJO57_01350 [Endozoicomonas sp. SCSIO W0465]